MESILSLSNVAIKTKKERNWLHSRSKNSNKTKEELKIRSSSGPPTHEFLWS